MPPLINLDSPWTTLFLATVLLLAIIVDLRREPGRPLLLRLCYSRHRLRDPDMVAAARVGSPVEPARLASARRPGLGGLHRDRLVGAGCPRRRGLSARRRGAGGTAPGDPDLSDLLAGAIYTATGLAVVNFVFDVPIGGLIATSGVIAIVLGLALQSTLSDVFSGIAMGLEHAYKPGDMLWVEGGIEGQVIQMSWRSTQIATLHNSVAVVPNSVIAKSRLENRSAPTPIRSVSVNVSVDAGADPRRCIAALRPPLTPAASRWRHRNP